MTPLPHQLCPEQPLTDSQLAAVARLRHAVAERSAAAVLVGPAGSGKSAVLARLVPLLGELPYRIIDDAHLLEPQPLAEIARGFASGRGPTVILAGQGRLLTLIARDTRLESAIQLRAVVGAMSRDESRRIAVALLADDSLPRVADDAMDTIHEIAGGMPRAVAAIARLGRLLLDEHPGMTLERGHVESLHRRLSVTAA